MKATRRPRSSTTSTVTYTFQNDNPTPPTPITVHFHDDHSPSIAAARIQAAYRSYVVRRLINKITSIKSKVDTMERLIQQQETVDALIRTSTEKLRINEELMRLLLELDSVPGVETAVRELRRNVSRRIVGLQEVVDGICQERIVTMDGWGWGWDWDEVIGGIEEQVCREKGGEELERFCARHLGFRCLRSFLHQP